jgi:hypothetical protein
MHFHLFPSIRDYEFAFLIINFFEICFSLDKTELGAWESAFTHWGVGRAITSLGTKTDCAQGEKRDKGYLRIRVSHGYRMIHQQAPMCLATPDLQHTGTSEEDEVDEIDEVCDQWA